MLGKDADPAFRIRKFILREWVTLWRSLSKEHRQRAARHWIAVRADRGNARGASKADDGTPAEVLVQISPALQRRLQLTPPA